MFATNSRYNSLPTLTYTMSGGRQVSYVARRFLPQSDRFAFVLRHTVTDSDRLDNIANRYLDDPQQFWRICDANNAMSPFDLTAIPGETLKIAMPQSLAGSPNA